MAVEMVVQLDGSYHRYSKPTFVSSEIWNGIICLHYTKRIVLMTGCLMNYFLGSSFSVPQIELHL